MQLYTLSQLSLAKGAGSSVTEMYIPLWSADGTYTQNNSVSTTYYINDGSTQINNPATSHNTLFTLNSNWPPSAQYALEATIWISSGGPTGYVYLYDITAGTTVTSISTTSTSAVVLRSSKITLTPGHSYGIGILGNYIYISDASLIVFP